MRAPTILASCLLAVGCSEGEDRGVAERVVLVTCDTLRADRIGAYGYGRDTTPRLDAFASSAVVFDRAYSASSLTLPAFCSMMTGRLPDELGMKSNRVVMSDEATTIAESLSAAGVETAAFVSNFVLRRRPQPGATGIHQGFDLYDDRMEDTEANRANIRERVAVDTTSATIAWLDAREGERFFLWVHYQDPHGPYTAPPAFRESYGDEDGEPPLRLGESVRGHGELPSYQALGDERRPAVYREEYDAEIRYFDAEFGRLIDALEERDLLDGALVIFTADHGESLGEHDWWFSHGQTLYRELVHVPLIVRYPEGLAHPAEAGRVASLVGHVDLFATVVEAFGLAPHATHGTSLVAPSLPDGRVLVQQLRAQGAATRWESVTDGRYRVVRGPASVALFDLETDPGELVDLATHDPERVLELTDRATRAARDLPAVEAEAVDADMSESDRETLRGLGYAE